MAKSRKTRKKKQLQPTSRKNSNKPAPKATSKQKTLVAILIFAMLLFVVGGLFKKSQNKNEVNSSTPTFRYDGNLSFERDGKNLATIEMEQVSTSEAINQGLMYRKEMQNNRGMLFIMPKNEMQSFWMRNTYIPLDIIFVNSDKRIVTIQKNATPLSETPRNSSVAAKYVVEVNAGFTDKYGIKTGDAIKF